MTLPDDTDIFDDLGGTGAVQVEAPSGAKIHVLTDLEKEYYEGIRDRYLKDNIISNISDLQDLDRILTMELMVYRWSQWLLAEQDYQGEAVPIEVLQKNINSYSKEVRQIKVSLGIDKLTREKDHGDTVAEYIANLRRRAHEFGVMRNEQAVKAITLWKELEGVYTLWQNSTEDERAKFNARAEDVLDWIASKLPEFDEIDKKFRQNQKYWVKEL